MQIYTTTLTSGSLTLNKEDGAMLVSLAIPTNSSCTFIGNLPFKNVAPTEITLSGGQVFNLATPTPISPLDGIVITWVSGSIDIVIGF